MTGPHSEMGTSEVDRLSFSLMSPSSEPVEDGGRGVPEHEACEPEFSMDPKGSTREGASWWTACSPMLGSDEGSAAAGLLEAGEAAQWKYDGPDGGLAANVRTQTDRRLKIKHGAKGKVYGSQRLQARTNSVWCCVMGGERDRV